MNKETIEIPLVKATYEELQEVICELQVERIVKDQEIERLNNIINETLKELEKIGDFYTTPSGEVIHLIDKILHINKAINKLKEGKE